MLSTWVSPFTEGHADFYGWDGSFQRRVEAAGNLLASIDGRYFVNFTTRQLMDSNGTFIRGFTEPTLAEGSTALNWARDGDYFCGLEQSGSGFALVAEDVAGNSQHIPLQVASDLVPSYGLGAMNIECSLTVNRAVVFGGEYPHARVALMSLPDGHRISDFEYEAGFYGTETSPDLHWLAATKDVSSGDTTEVVDTTNGSVAAKLDGSFYLFTPDGRQLVGDDPSGNAGIVDWRTKTELWTGPSRLDTWVDRSDPETNRMLLWLTTGSAMQGTETYDYWIVDGDGSGFRFNPRDCVPIEASPTRVCPP